MAEVEFSIQRAGFATIRLDTDGGGPYGLQSGTAGLGVGPVYPRFVSGAGDGARFAGDRVGAKPMDLGLIFLGDDRLSTGDLIRDLRSMTRTIRGQPQPVLVAEFADGSAFEVPFVYTSGLELDHSDALPWVYTATVAVMCPNPYWLASTATEFMVRNDDLVGLLPHLAELPVMSSSAIGSIQVENPGDVECPVEWRITGPGGPPTISINGRGFVFKSALVAGEIITIVADGERVSVTDQTGANRYPLLGPAPKFPFLPTGVSTVDITMPNAVPGVSAVAGLFKPRREVVY